MYPLQIADRLSSLDFHFQDWPGVLYPPSVDSPIALSLLPLANFSSLLVVGILGLLSQWLLTYQTSHARGVADVRRSQGGVTILRSCLLYLPAAL